MRNRSTTIFAFLILTTFLVTGCATARARRADAKPTAAQTESQIETLQGELQAKDQQIQDLQYQLDQNRQGGSANFSSGSGSKSSKIRVSGVSISDVQSALVRSGFDPGPVDGKMGKKTKAAIKAFQRAHNLNPDGVVGDKTWKLLQA